MSAAMTCWGVYREAAHSPGRIDDDAAILERVGAVLAERGFRVELIAADDGIEALSANVFVMCERGTILDRLAGMEKAGSIVVNSPAAIRNTYRHRMIELFAQHRVPAPLSRIVATDAAKPRPADCVWVKRYDFHATQPDDVMYIASETGWRQALREFAARGIPFVDRSGACSGRSGQILRRQKRRWSGGRQLVPMVLSSRQRHAGPFVRRGSPA